ncbi:unnamed protein product [Pieris brassicae]|uniref:CCHC-type domain-containing protein n=1 Tax=Pieris brassicae TaxID=7116 RepID=A0A9P0TK32_PIEBR|nr:unnamed protein product [Pieris brassicae]
MADRSTAWVYRLKFLLIDCGYLTQIVNTTQNMECAASPSTSGKTRKRIAKPEKWKRNVSKRKRYSFVQIPIKPDCQHHTGPFKCNSLTMQDLMKFHKNFYKHPNKETQYAGCYHSDRTRRMRACTGVSHELVDVQQYVTIQNKKFRIRPLISRNKRIILSNVCPIIPYKELEKKLEEINVKPMSQISFLRAGLNEVGYNHILSFRRQVYVTPEDYERLPEKISIEYDDTNYWIYLSSDTLTCFVCKKEGHVATKCPEREREEKIPYSDVSENTTHTVQGSHFKRPHPLTESISTTNPELKIETTINNDFEISSDAQIEDFNDNLSQSSVEEFYETNDGKKLKISHNNNLDPLDATFIDDFIGSSDKTYPLTGSLVKEYLDAIYGIKDIGDITRTYTKDITSLIELFNDIIPLVPHKNFKNRIRCVIFRKDRNDGYGGLAIIVHNSVACRLGPSLNTNNRIDTLCLEILNNSILKFMVGVYSSPNISINQKDYEALFKDFFQKTFIAGFGSPQTDVCSTCLQHDELLKVEKDISKRNDIMIDRRVHKLRAKAFYDLVREEYADVMTFSLIVKKMVLCLNFLIKPLIILDNYICITVPLFRALVRQNFQRKIPLRTAGLKTLLRKAQMKLPVACAFLYSTDFVQQTLLE